MHRDRVVRHDFIVPHLPVDLLGRKHLARVAAQQLEDLILKRRHAHRLAVHGHGFALRVQHQPADHDLLFGRLHRAELGVAPQLALDPRDQLGRVKGLCDVVVRARGQAEDLVRVLALGREQDDRDVLALAHLEQRFDAVHFGHHDVQQQQMHRAGHDDVERFEPVICLFDGIAFRPQEDRNAVHDLLVVVHHQYL